jgi:hypothetical protein
MTAMNINDAMREVYFWRYSNTGSFHNMLFDLFQKADNDNLVILGNAYPSEYLAWYMWTQAADHGDTFFRDYGLME